MVTALGGFFGELDEKLQLHDARAHVPTSRAGLTARSLRVKILQASAEAREARVSAVIQGAEGSLVRSIYPQYKKFWNLRKIPMLPAKMGEARVADVPFMPGACLPEIEHCRGGTAAKPIPLDQPVTSDGFIVHLSLAFVDFRPGMKIKGVVALSDE